MEVELYTFQNKLYRSLAIKRYMDMAGYDRAVCFSCGNASAYLKAVGVNILDISPSGDMIANRWFKPCEIKKWFPNCFDATSGHVPIDCLRMIADEFKNRLGRLPDEINLPTGSGETLIALKLAFPATRITAVYNLNSATQYDEECELNKLVKIMAEKIIFADKEGIEWLEDRTNTSQT